jgi:hypothetical protein
MKIFLLLIPVITAILGMSIYKFQDKKKEIFKLDLSQFVYLFVIAPTFFVWSKSFIFYILRSELQYNLSITDLFVVDTIFSVLGFIIIISIAIHSLTKTFRLKRDRDPSFDLFHLSEYFHLWWTHIVMWLGAMLAVTFVSFVNVLVPFKMGETPKIHFYSLLVVGFLAGVMFFVAVWNSDAKQNNYMRLMKLLFALFFVLHVGIYFILDPGFKMSYAGYWFSFFMFLSAVMAGSTFERYEKPKRLRKKLFLHFNWGNNTNIFKKK